MPKKEETKNDIQLTDAIAVKYRPRLFSEIIGNEDNIGTITGYLKMGQLVKSWGMFGPSGSGKSTTARILAMAVNCQDRTKEGEPCLKCSSCKAAMAGTHVDIREINAGSEEGKVSGIESLLETIKYKPRYNARVIIIDESHLASSKAQQSLLKAVEEPPKGVMFILCTTNPEKLPYALLGRCVKLYFKYPEPKVTAKRMYSICKKEYSEDIVEKIKPFLIPIAKNTKAQVRNALSIMERMVSLIHADKKIKGEQLKETLKNLLFDTGELDTFAIRYCTFLCAGKLALPLSFALELDPDRVPEFISLTARYAQYAAVYFMYREDIPQLYRLRRKFWGVSFDRFDAALEAIYEKKGKDASLSCIKVAAGLIAAQEKLRMGLISPDQAIMYGISKTL